MGLVGSRLVSGALRQRASYCVKIQAPGRPESVSKLPPFSDGKTSSISSIVRPPEIEASLLDKGSGLLLSLNGDSSGGIKEIQIKNSMIVAAFLSVASG